MVLALTALHVLVALILIMVVLLQSARGTDVGSAFGGMGSQTAFGPRGTTTFLSKTTAVLAGIFMITSLSLSILSNRSRGGGGSVLSGEKQAPAKPKPTAPGAIPTPATPGTPGQPVQPAVTVTPVQPPKPAAPAGQTAPASSQPAAPAAPPAPATSQ